MMPSIARMAAVVRLELRTQRREPLTLLYVLVLGLLSMAFAAAGPVELVRGRGAVPAGRERGPSAQLGELHRG